ncbi:hypothetical protein BJ170DRAFT_371658 [Xylariales sp. AK1849]|nr:hypothetical protein BJ170DRAFT_371658 [Xylariales sp. AK1849]
MFPTHGHKSAECADVSGGFLHKTQGGNRQSPIDLTIYQDLLQLDYSTSTVDLGSTEPSWNGHTSNYDGHTGSVSYFYTRGYSIALLTTLSTKSQQYESIMAPSPTTMRSSKRRRNTASSLDSSSKTSDSSREKNRIAASKCRKKKQADERELEERCRSLQTENLVLNDSAAALRSEVLTLKIEVLEHGRCEFPPIQSYIQLAASQI